MFQKIASAKLESERITLFEPLDELVTYIQFANDECDYGEGIELGLDLLAFHPKGNIFTNAFVPKLLKSFSVDYFRFKKIY